jgi:hypothetical protein
MFSRDSWSSPQLSLVSLFAPSRSPVSVSQSPSPLLPLPCHMLRWICYLFPVGLSLFRFFMQDSASRRASAVCRLDGSALRVMFLLPALAFGLRSTRARCAGFIPFTLHLVSSHCSFFGPACMSIALRTPRPKQAMPAFATSYGAAGQATAGSCTKPS